VQLELEPITEGLGYLDASAIGSTGLRLVDYGLGTSLRDVFLGLKWIAHDGGNRREDDFCNRSAQETFSLLISSLYGEHLVESHASDPDN
jgi:hypothetical protein